MKNKKGLSFQGTFGKAVLMTVAILVLLLIVWIVKKMLDRQLGGIFS